MSVGAGARPSWRPLGRLVGVLLVCVIVLGGCAGLMGDSIETLMKQGIDLLTAGKYDEAIAKFLEVVKRDPKSSDAYLYLTRAYIGKGSWTDAIASGRKALELAPNRTDVVPALAQAFLGAGKDALRQGRFSEAVGHFVEYVKLKPADFLGFLDLGRAYLGTGAYADAFRAFVQGLGQNPDPDARAQLVRALFDGGSQALAAGNSTAAIDFLREYVGHDSANVSAYLELGRAYWSSGQVSSAFGAFQRVLQLIPNNAEALQFLRGTK